MNGEVHSSSVTRTMLDQALVRVSEALQLSFSEPDEQVACETMFAALIPFIFAATATDGVDIEKVNQLQRDLAEAEEKYKNDMKKLLVELRKLCLRVAKIYREEVPK